MYHLAALHGNIRLLKRGIEEDVDLLSKQFQCSDLRLVEDCELNDTEYVPPPLLPRLVRAAVHNCSDLLDETVGCEYGTFGLLSRRLPLDQRNRLDVVKLLLSMGSNVQAVNAVHRTAEEYTTSRDILELLLRPVRTSIDRTDHRHQRRGNDSIGTSSHSENDKGGGPLRKDLRSQKGTRAVSSSRRTTVDCAEGSSPVPAATSNKSRRHRQLRKQKKATAAAAATPAAAAASHSERRLTTMKRLSVAPTASEQASQFDPRAFSRELLQAEAEGPSQLDAPPPMTNSVLSPSHHDREYPTAMDLLEALFPLRRVDEASAEAKDGQQLGTSMVALFRKLVPLEEVATAALLGRDATRAIIISPNATSRAEQQQQHSTDCTLLNAVISNTIAVHHSDQEDELDQVIREINVELQVRDKINAQKQQQQHYQPSRPPTKQSSEGSKVTCKELIWRRAGVYLDSPLTGRMKQEHVQLKRDALSRGLRVLEEVGYGSPLDNKDEQWAAAAES